MTIEVIGVVEIIILMVIGSGIGGVMMKLVEFNSQRWLNNVWWLVMHL